MPAFSNSPRRENTYIIDPENETEMARLMLHDRLLTKGMGGLFPERSDFSTIHKVLDIACGPGGWVLDVARTYPKIQVAGIDISQRMIDYAQAQAWVRGLPNASFRVMDATKPLDFPDDSFDLVNARFLFGFMLPASWPRLLQECQRILRPGRIVRLTEAEWGFTNAPAFEKLCSLSSKALQQAGQSFSPTGQHTGITPMLKRLLRDARYQHIQHMAHMIEFSAGTEAYDGFYQNLMTGFKLLQPFLIKWGGTTQQEVEDLYQQTRVEMQSDDFCAIWFLLTVWGQRPEPFPQNEAAAS